MKLSNLILDWRLIILFSFTGFSEILCEEELKCFLPGACSDSYHVDGDTMSSKMACLEYCQSKEACLWFTFYPSFQYCQLFANCSTMETNQCSDCLSGQSACRNPVCWVSAECEGNVYHLERVNTQEECLKVCQNKVGCKWFTFHLPSSACLLYHNCQTLDESCQNCITGEANCEVQPVTTTTTTVTSTTTTTTTTTDTNESFVLSTTTTSTTSEKITYEKFDIPNDEHRDSSRGQVAVVLGGFSEHPPNNLVEVFSPDGECQHDLAPLPVPELINPVLVLLDGHIVTCGDNFDPRATKGHCWLYNSTSDSWSHFTSRRSHTLNKNFIEQPGQVFEDKLYLLHDVQTEVFDPETMSWRFWPPPPKISFDQVYRGACILTYEDSFVVMGGLSQKSEVIMFNHTTQVWRRLGKPPMHILNSGCILLPGSKILVLGFFQSAYQKTAAIFDIKKRQWQSLGDTHYLRVGTSLVKLGKRIFALDGGGPLTEVVEEYNYQTNSWTTSPGQLKYHRRLHASIAVPAEMFQHFPGGCKGVV